ncbi:UNVERIFIED_ORG: glycine C-acetyltransferase [Shinella zoogloeoides]|nr:glycine C-acetyltransferase [Shinella zoogloeoides]
MLNRFVVDLETSRQQGFEKHEAVLSSAQGREVTVLHQGSRRTLINMCANNYLGLANHPEVIGAATRALGSHGFGMASVRFICGTQDLHKRLENRLSAYLGTDDTLLYSSCFDANTGLFETLFGAEDALISDELNHASIIDGIRLCKAARHRYRHGDMENLEAILRTSQAARTRAIVTDGVFSMDGSVASLPAICDLARRYKALVVVDDSHAVGVVGPGGRGTPSLHGVEDQVDILTGTLGKALGGASGGYVSGRKALIDWLRQASRPYLFSNSLMPAICAGSLAAIDLAANSLEIRETMNHRVTQLRSGLQKLGFQAGGVDHPIVPILVGDSEAAQAMSDLLFKSGVLAVAFSYPVVPKGAARVRLQVSALHRPEDILQVLGALESFSHPRCHWL